MQRSGLAGFPAASAVGRLRRRPCAWPGCSTSPPTTPTTNFTSFAEPRWGSIAAGFRVDPTGPTSCIVSYEARTRCHDTAARQAFKRYWSLVPPFVGHIQRALLRAVTDWAGRMIGVGGCCQACAGGARRTAELAGADVQFVQADVYDAVDVLGPARFDLVFTGVGALNWLPSVDRWAAVVAWLLRPGGRLFIREGHPVLWSLDYDRADDLLVLEYPYGEQREPQVWDEPGTYVATDVQFQHYRTHEWNHGLGEIVTALLDHGLRLTMLEEHDSVPWQPMSSMRQVERHGVREWQLADRPQRLPHTYTLQAVKDR